MPFLPMRPRQVNSITERLASTPTVASVAARHDFDAQSCHIQFLKLRDGRVQPFKNQLRNPTVQFVFARTKSAQSARGGSMDTTQAENSAKSSTESWTPGLARYYLGYQAVNSDELRSIVERLTKPTLASRGGIDLRDKRYEYIPKLRLKTLPVIDGLESRYRGDRAPATPEALDEIVRRLTRPTAATTARDRSTPNPNDKPTKRVI
ncbi:uncharacterized protein LOC141908282 [Tubulanus polymorphus]|uniref:uncharacterized protein LOC141908282 n=1 Tax=Tubulanus polymorphus TaxID=672921 RepID=UPI003DA225E8